MELMRAAVMRDRTLVVADVPVPQPGPGEVLVRTLACGICGSDLHALKHAEKFVETERRAGLRVMDLGRDVVMGHEFCAEIVEHGPRTRRALAIGTRVCSRPTTERSISATMACARSGWPWIISHRGLSGIHSRITNTMRPRQAPVR